MLGEVETPTFVPQLSDQEVNALVVEHSNKEVPTLELYENQTNPSHYQSPPPAEEEFQGRKRKREQVKETATLGSLEVPQARRNPLRRARTGKETEMDERGLMINHMNERLKCLGISILMNY